MAKMYKLVGVKTLAFPGRTNVFNAGAHYTKDQVGEYLNRESIAGQPYFEEFEVPDDSVQSIAPKGPVYGGSLDLTADVPADAAAGSPKKITIGGKVPSKTSIEV